MRHGYRNVNKAICSCGGEVEEVDVTDEEEKEYGCGRPGCCVEAAACKKCGTRWMFSLEAPEME